MQYTITAPIPAYNGAVAGVQFHNGTAVIDGVADRAALSYFQRHDAYGVVPHAGDPAPDPGPDGDGLKAPGKNTSKKAWAEYALALGVDPDLVDAADNRDDLMVLVDAHEQEADQ